MQHKEPKASKKAAKHHRMSRRDNILVALGNLVTFHVTPRGKGVRPRHVLREAPLRWKVTRQETRAQVKIEGKDKVKDEDKQLSAFSNMCRPKRRCSESKLFIYSAIISDFGVQCSLFMIQGG